ncbi:lanthionine synthetase LanC family protein [Flavobacterium poyangense]|uniref:lanthionine synthetase LanC family protein n=1 Tax=Flavobacterium poyangense TaxID=2204302 RepID=UPI00141EE4CA|nr:lanthionine synthetase LanC family protein [Flavobacterium sp. JXAS1]
MDQTNKNIFLETAWNIGTSLLKSSIWHDKSCTWQGYSFEPLNGTYQPVIRSFGPDVYSGTAGIALFLTALYSEREDPILLKTIEGSVEQMKSTMYDAINHGFYAGKPGIAATLIKIGKELNRPNWIQAGLDLLDSIPSESLQSYEIDIISGAAGTIPVLLDVHNTFKKPELLTKAIALGRLLCGAAVKNEKVWSWATVPSQKNLTGFSHGSSGIALALLQLYQETGDSMFLEAAEGGFNYERQSFDNTQQNWPDFRDDVVASTATNVCGLAWCHGAPGITISRLKANQLHPDPVFVSEMGIALTTTTNSVYQSLMENLTNTNYSICHGIAGNADIIMDCGGKEYQELAEAVGNAGIHKYQNNTIQWPTGLSTGQYTPGLMMGVAGTGYFYLRLLNKDKHKSVLVPQLGLA